MIIKKFVPRTEEEAAEAARKELGSGVVIMNVKAVKRKGLAALFRAKQTEVTVALEEEHDNGSAVRREAKPAAYSAGESAVRREEDDGRDSIEKKLDNLQSLLMNRFQQSEAQREEGGIEGEIPGAEPPEEVPEETEGPEEVTEQQRFIRLLYNTMLESEVDEKYANQIVDDVDVSGQSNLPIDYILENVYQKMILKFGRAEGILPSEDGPRIVLFMGPTGVGKTTTIAKIASSYAVEGRKRVALLTADTYRIAAVEQLRTYANILEVPFRVLYSEEDVQAAVAEFREYDYIFVDTTGHSHQNEEQLAHTRKLFATLREAGKCQTFLVLSATTKYRDLLKIVASYEGIDDFQLIFTKLDETAAMGNLLNLRLFTGTAIAFVTNGQNVPNDIEQFNPQKTVKQILSTRQEQTL